VRNIGVAPEPVNVALQNGSRTKRQFEWRVVVVDAPAQ
jgi:hypothetical protein